VAAVWWWILVWVLLVIAAVAVLGLLGWRLFKQVVGLGREFGASGTRIADAMSGIRAPGPVVPSSVLAIPPDRHDVHLSTRGARRRSA
jgi:hypothetical protein